MHESFNVHDYPKIILPSVLLEVILDMCVCVCVHIICKLGIRNRQINGIFTGGPDRQKLTQYYKHKCSPGPLIKFQLFLCERGNRGSEGKKCKRFWVFFGWQFVLASS